MCIYTHYTVHTHMKPILCIMERGGGEQHWHDDYAKEICDRLITFQSGTGRDGARNNRRKESEFGIGIVYGHLSADRGRAENNRRAPHDCLLSAGAGTLLHHHRLRSIGRSIDRLAHTGTLLCSLPIELLVIESFCKGVLS